MIESVLNKTTSKILLCTVALSAHCWAAPILYQNGILNPTLVGGFGVSGAGATSNSFVLGGAATAQSVTFGSLTFAGSTVSNIDWIISANSFGGGTVFASGTAPVLNVPAGDSDPTFDINSSTFALPNVFLSAGNYFLTLQNGTGTPSNLVAWVQAGGPTTSTAETSFAGPVPSEFFFISGVDAPELDPARGIPALSFCFLTLLTAQRSNRKKSA